MGQKTHKIAFDDDRKHPVVFEVGDDTFEFTPPKMFTFMETVTESRKEGVGEEQMFGVMMDLLYASLPDSQAERFRERLRDNDDPFDVDHVVDIFQTLTKEVTDRPTLSTLGD